MKTLFAPNIDDTQDLLTGNAVAWLRLTVVTKSLLRARMGELEKNPPWLVDAHSALTDNRDVGFDWFSKAPDIKSSVVSPFIQYSSKFSAFTQLAPVSDDQTSVDTLISMMQSLVAKIDMIIAEMGTGSGTLAGVAKEFGAAHSGMTKAVNEAKLANAENEKALLKSAAAIARIEQKIDDLAGDITSTDLSAGEVIIDNEIELIFEAAVGEGAIPIVGVGLVILTLVIDAIEIIKASVEINEALDELSEAMKEQISEVQAAVAIQSVLTAFGRLNTLYIEAQEPAPKLALIWKDERDKLTIAIEALQADAKPTEMLVFKQLQQANDTWTKLTNFAVPLLALGTGKSASTTLTVRGTAPKQS